MMVRLLLFADMVPYPAVERKFLNLYRRNPESCGIADCFSRTTIGVGPADGVLLLIIVELACLQLPRRLVFECVEHPSVLWQAQSRELQISHPRQAVWEILVDFLDHEVHLFPN